MPEKEIALVIQGAPISPGLAEGIIHVHHSPLDPIDVPGHIEQTNVEEEIWHLDAATLRISDDLITLAAKVEREIDSRLAQVFTAHQLILLDSSLKEELKKEIAGNLVSASSAVKTVFLRWEKRFLLMESQIARDKGDDIRDVAIRLRNALAGITVHPLDEIPHGCVLVTSRLLPSDTVFLAGRSTAAVLLEYGSAGSHAALFSREMGLPCISRLHNLMTTVPDGALALVDAYKGTVTIRPHEKQKVIFRKRAEDKEHSYNLARERALNPAVTKDGVAISVLANVGCSDDTENAMLNGAEGVGLYRMERVYLGRVVPPSIDELLNEMRQTLSAAKGRTVCVRLLDIGADKPLPFMRFLAETNPSLGRRGIRLLCEYPELLKTHLRAVLELAREFDVHVLVPMVTLPDDVSVVKEYLTQLGSEMQLSSLPKLGAMIETPAAALSAREIAKHVDFLSFGTNDLAQYTFAADRENAAVEQYFNDSADAIFRLLRITHDDVPDVPLSICGELAGRPAHIPKLLQCGIRTFSIVPPLIPIIKEVIRNSLVTAPLTRNQ
ncbi:MAG: phosphoenolpyruvate--protein phosphotransferase [Acidobacteria bacterium]|nr:phosphoenolpyruvate--protein phosphotransferase [Acidobacteriota bacterium]